MWLAWGQVWAQELVLARVLLAQEGLWALGLGQVLGLECLGSLAPAGMSRHRWWLRDPQAPQPCHYGTHADSSWPQGKAAHRQATARRSSAPCIGSLKAYTQQQQFSPAGSSYGCCCLGR